MRAGALRHRISIQQVTEGRGSGGGITESWATFITLWGSVEPIKGREYFDSAKINAEVTHRIKHRYHPGITPKMRVSWDDRIFRIESMLDIDERGKEVHLMCVEVV